MGNGVNISSGNLMSVTDMCGQKVLGMSGSLLNYINTGNAGTLSNVDSFNNTNEVQNKKQEKQKKHIDFGKILKFSAIAFSLIAGGALLFSKFTKKPNLEQADESKKTFAKFWNKIKNFFRLSNVEAKNDSQELKDTADKLKATGDKIGEIANGNTPLCLASPKQQFVPEINNEEANEQVLNLLNERIARNNPQNEVKTAAETLKENAIELLGLPEPKQKAPKVSRRKPIVQPETPDVILLGEPKENEKAERVLSQAKKADKKVGKKVDKKPAKKVDNKPAMSAVDKMQSQTVPMTQVIDKVVIPEDKLEELTRRAQEAAKPLEIDVDDINLRLQRRNNNLDTYDSQLIRRKLAKEDTGFDYVKAYKWSVGDKFRVYDPETQEKIGYRYQIDKNGVPKPLIQNSKPTKKAAKKVIGSSGFYIPYEEKETYAYLNNQIRNVEKATGLDLSEIMYKFGDDIPDESIKVEDIIREFGGSN